MTDAPHFMFYSPAANQRKPDVASLHIDQAQKCPALTENCCPFAGKRTVMCKSADVYERTESALISLPCTSQPPKRVNLCARSDLCFHSYCQLGNQWSSCAKVLPQDSSHLHKSALFSHHLFFSALSDEISRLKCAIFYAPTPDLYTKCPRTPKGQVKWALLYTS